MERRKGEGWERVSWELASSEGRHHYCNKEYAKWEEKMEAMIESTKEENKRLDRESEKKRRGWGTRRRRNFGCSWTISPSFLRGWGRQSKRGGRDWSAVWGGWWERCGWTTDLPLPLIRTTRRLQTLMILYVMPVKLSSHHEISSQFFRQFSIILHALPATAWVSQQQSFSCTMYHMYHMYHMILDFEHSNGQNHCRVRTNDNYCTCFASQAWYLNLNIYTWKV